MTGDRIDWIGALGALELLVVIPLIFGSSYIIGVMTVALCYGMWAASWDFMSGLTGRENFGHSLFIGAGARPDPKTANDSSGATAGSSLRRSGRSDSACVRHPVRASTMSPSL